MSLDTSTILHIVFGLILGVLLFLFIQKVIRNRHYVPYFIISFVFIFLGAFLYIILTISLLVSACELSLTPHDGMTKEQLSEYPEGAGYATNGNYAMIKDILEYKGVEDLRNTYVRHYFQLSEFPGDNVSLSGSTTDHLFYACTYQHFATMMNTTYFWFSGYKIINGSCQIIESVEEGIFSDVESFMEILIERN